MASVLRFHDTASFLTPPPSDRGECEDSAMLLSDSYQAEVFYPSPAPSFSHQLPNFTPHSPDLGHSDSTYDTEEDNQPMFFVSGPEAQLFTNVNTSSLQNPALYSTAMPYPSYEPSSWMPYAPYPNTTAMFPYASDDSSAAMYTSYISQGSRTNAIPPIPQGVTPGSSYDFNDLMSRPQDTPSHLRTFSTASVQHHPPTAPSTTSVSGVSSRSVSPNLAMQVTPESQSSRRPSFPTRPSSSPLHAYGIPIRSPGSTAVQAWRCAFPNCTSRAVFTRGCDLRKHYNRHSKHLFCRVEGCPQSETACIAVAQQQAIQAGAEVSDPSKLAVTGGFSSKKDRARHEAKHNPGIKCEWKGPNGEECGRLFSRMDNMKDHVRRIHNKGQPHSHTQASPSKKKLAQ